jgi:type I restriction enzyme R subunit
MGLIAKFTQHKSSKQKMTRAQLISLLSSDAKLMEEREDLTAYINTLDSASGQTVEQIREGYQNFKAEKHAKELKFIAQKHGLGTALLQNFVEDIISRMIFDGEKLTDLLEPLELSWKERRVKELALMGDLVPLLHKQVPGREISGLKAYE